MKNTKVKYSFAQWCRDNGHEDWLNLWDYELNDCSPEDVTYGMKKKCYFKCGDCEASFQKRLDYVSNYGLRCSNCGDGISYPNKYVREFLYQLKNVYNFNVHFEHIFEWSSNVGKDKNRRLYDCVIEDDNNVVIIEVHGGQHYFESFLFNGARTLSEEQENDMFKYNLAIKNGIKPENYIIIDARKSDDLWTKQSIIKCGIQNIYPFNEYDIDWIKCSKFASSNVAKQVCNKYMHGGKDINNLCSFFGLNRATVRNYLKQGTKNGWCDYMPQPCNKNNPIICSKNNFIFSSASECARMSEQLFGTRLTEPGISQILCKKRDSYKGYCFERISIKEFKIQKNINPDIVFGNLY